MGQCGRQEGHGGLVGAPMSSILALDTPVTCQCWSQDRGCRCCPHAAAEDQPMCARHVQPHEDMCAGAPGSARLLLLGCCPFWGNVFAALPLSRPWPHHTITTGNGGQSCPPQIHSQGADGPCHGPIPAPPPHCPAGTTGTSGSLYMAVHQSTPWIGWDHTRWARLGSARASGLISGPKV